MQAAEKNALRGVHGPVANLMTTDKRYAVAIEIALGAGMQNVVVDREEDAKSAINFLKQRDGGRATFLPLTAIRGDVLREAGVEREYGYVGVASQLVQFDQRYTEIFNNLLGRTVVVEDMDCGIAIARKYSNRFRIVTLDGQVLNRGGSMTGGSVSRSAGILSRANELKELTARREALTEKLDAALREADEAKRDLNAAQYELDVAREQQRGAEDAVLRLTGEKKQYDMLLESLRTRESDIAAELESITARTEELKKAAAAARGGNQKARGRGRTLPCGERGKARRPERAANVTARTSATRSPRARARLRALLPSGRRPSARWATSRRSPSRCAATRMDAVRSSRTTARRSRPRRRRSRSMTR